MKQENPKSTDGVFVCYAHEDADLVLADLEYLKDCGLTLWYDADIPGGSHWRAEIGAAMDRVSHVLFFVSRNSLASEHCNREVNYALDENKVVVPVRLDNTPLTADLRVGLGRVQAISRESLPKAEYLRRLQTALTPAPAVETTRTVRKKPSSTAIATVLVATLSLLTFGVLWIRDGGAPSGQNPDSEAILETSSDRSIVVLPLVNMSSDLEQSYFSDGISEELINLLARYSDLKVISRTSAFYYKNRDMDLPEIASELDVAHVLEGSVRKDGQRVRVTVQLIDTRTNTHIWSETYDRQLDDIFAVQDDIAGQVAQKLRATILGTVESQWTPDPEAYLFYLQARYLLHQSRSESVAEATALLVQAVNTDPEFLDAWLELARAYDAAGELEFAVQATTAAAAIDPTDAVVNAWQAWQAMNEGDLRSAAAGFERALRSQPANIDVLRPLAALLERIDRVEEAILVSEKVIARDPLCMPCRFNLIRTLYIRGAVAPALALTESMLALDPGYESALLWQAVLNNSSGNYQAALIALDRVRTDTPFSASRTMLKLLSLHGLDRTVEFESELSEYVKEEGARYPDLMARVLAGTGDVSGALEWLDRVVSLTQTVPLPIHEPLFRRLHSDPRWTTFIERMDIVPSELAKIPLDLSPLELEPPG